MRHDPDVADLGEVYGGRGGHFFLVLVSLGSRKSG
jgi:hypothetical protein